MDHIQSLGVDSIWFSPFYEFGNVDMGNDVINHTRVHPDFGTEQDLDDLFQDIKSRGIGLFAVINVTAVVVINDLCPSVETDVIPQTSKNDWSSHLVKWQL